MTFSRHVIVPPAQKSTTTPCNIAMFEETPQQRDARLADDMVQAIIIEQSFSCDATYRKEYETFCEWVQNQPELNTPSKPFVTPRNVDEYFRRVVVHRKLGKSTVRHVGSALDAHYAGAEIVARVQLEIDGHDVPVIKGRINERESVRRSLSQQAKNMESSGPQRPGTDPHKGLKDIITEEDCIRAMRYAYRQRDWASLVIHFLYGQNGAIRGASNRNLRYCDLKYSNTFVHDPKSPGHGCLIVVIRKGPDNKDRHEQDKQVAYWRHKEYNLCSVFATAAHIVLSLSRNTEIEFYHHDKKQRASWWDVQLTDWNNYQSTYIWNIEPI